jgi:hypothetical protein
MWAGIAEGIGRLVGTKDLGVARVNEVFGIELAPTLDKPLARHYRATLPAGLLRDVELRVIPETGMSVLVLRPHPDRPVVVRPDDLRSFWTPKSRSIEPKAGPEGQVAECYALYDMKLRVGYRAKSRQLEVVSLEAKGERPG